MSRRKVLVIQAQLDALAVNEEVSLGQLGANRDAALEAIEGTAVPGVDEEAILAVCRVGVDTVHTAASVKRTGLETELVTADAALGEAIDATVAIAEVRTFVVL